jgi:hypothetical protein
MSAAQAAGTLCALSESCVGTTTQRGSCDLGVPLHCWLNRNCSELNGRTEDMPAKKTVILTGAQQVIGAGLDGGCQKAGYNVVATSLYATASLTPSPSLAELAHLVLKVLTGLDTPSLAPVAPVDSTV